MSLPSKHGTQLSQHSNQQTEMMLVIQRQSRTDVLSPNFRFWQAAGALWYDHANEGLLFLWVSRMHPLAGRPRLSWSQASHQPTMIQEFKVNRDGCGQLP
jgi:hypothetical protein